jgi:pyruvate, orthophosphate dikinase
VTLALEMFAVAPATGKASLSPLQESLLAGKARWLHLAFEAGLPVVPTIAITRAAWEGLMAERRRGEERLRTHWVATLFRLVGRDGKPPALVVRTSAEQHSQGLMPARIGLPPPASEPESVDPSRPLARAIADAFESYGDDASIWIGAQKSATRAGQIVLVQAVAEGRIGQFLTRDPVTGRLGPAAVNGCF